MGQRIWVGARVVHQAVLTGGQLEDQLEDQWGDQLGDQLVVQLVVRKMHWQGVQKRDSMVMRSMVQKEVLQVDSMEWLPSVMVWKDSQEQLGLFAEFPISHQQRRLA